MKTTIYTIYNRTTNKFLSSMMPELNIWGPSPIKTDDSYQLDLPVYCSSKEACETNMARVALNCKVECDLEIVKVYRQTIFIIEEDFNV